MRGAEPNMYRIPEELDLSAAVGESISQIQVGKYDIQFSLGKVQFSIWSPIRLIKNGKEIGQWNEGNWPDPAFVEVFNENITEVAIPNNQSIILRFENGVEMRLTDESDQFESMSISIGGESGPWII